MQVTRKDITPTKVEMTITASQDVLDATKDHVLSELAKDIDMSGFRKGHAPKALIEKSVDPATLQSRFLDRAVNALYMEAAVREKLRPVSQSQIEVTKFVPFTELEFRAEVEVVGAITLPDYKKIKVAKQVEPTTDKDINAVLDDLRRRDAKKTDVKRAAKDGDEVVIDFSGVDAKTKAAIAGATGTSYPLTLGTNTFIPGFEPELIGLKTGDKKTFPITFPKNYGATELQSKQVSFTVEVKAVREVKLPKLDGEFAGKVGPFKTVAELKADIKKQLEVEKDNQAQRVFENELLTSIAEKAEANIPDVLIDEEADRMEAEEKRNLVYRGQTWKEHLELEGITEEQHKANMREQAESRVKAGLVLGEIAEAENITVSDAELDEHIAQLKKKYQDKQMQAELDKPENHRELASRLLTEKTIARLTHFAQKA